MNTSYLLLGSNLGDRSENLKLAQRNLEDMVGRIDSFSSIYETEAWGKEDQQSFLNQALKIGTSQSANEVLENCLAIELALGRKRMEKWAERTIDIDILFFNNEVINAPRLTVPHPEIQKRRFALIPMLQLAPRLMHPILDKTIEQLEEECIDPLEVWEYSTTSKTKML